MQVKPTPSCNGYGADDVPYRTFSKCVDCNDCPAYPWTTLLINGVPFVSIRGDHAHSAAYARLVDNHELWIFTALANEWMPHKGAPNA